MLRELYLHPSGQLPAYEWNFSDVNPPVHAWATLARLRDRARAARRRATSTWLKSAFQKLLVNFTWWINRKDPTGRNVFEGGFLGLDNIGVFDRSAPLPTGGRLEQSDGTAWMAFFSQCMLGIALELAAARPAVRGHGAQVRRALRLHRRRDGPHRRQPRRAVGRGGRLLLRRAAPPRRAAPSGSRCARWSACCRCAPRRSCRSRAAQLSDDLLARLRRRIEAMPELLATIHDARVPGVERAAHAGRARRDQAAPHPRPDARRGRVPQPARPAGAVALPPRAPVPLRRARRDLRGALPAGRVRHGHVRRQLELAGPGVVPGQLPRPARPAAPLRVLRRRLQGRVPDRLGPASARCSRWPTSSAAGWRRSSSPTTTAAGRCTAAPRCSRPTRTGRTCCSSTSTSTATTAPASAPATRPAGPASWPGSSRSSATSDLRTCSPSALHGNLVYRGPSGR